MALEGRTVVFGLTGGIACYKACEAVRLLIGRGAVVRAVMTRGARQFVTPLTLETLTGHPVGTETFERTQESEIGHIALADAADGVVVAPATANVLAKLAAGIADDLLTTVLLATRAPVLVAPGMNVHMWEHPATQDNVRRLVARGVQLVGPGCGPLACGYEGVGRLAEPAEIVEAVERLLVAQDLTGERLLVSAGPTREAIDPVRFLSNHSSGKMGCAIARVARRRGAEVVLVHGAMHESPPAGVRVIAVESARAMAEALATEFSRATVLIMAAAVADYRPRQALDRKLKKASTRLALALDRNPDIVSGLAARKGRRIVIGFAAETHAVAEEALRKLREKRLDLIVANDVTAPGAGFGSDTNVVRLFDSHGSDVSLPRLPKEEVAARILDWVVARRAGAATRRRPGAPGARRRSRA